MNERIKQVRQTAGLTQSAFAAALGLSRNYIAMMEIGQRDPSDRTIADICRVYNVDEVWLRTGVGKPFAEKSRRDAIDAYLSELSDGRRSDLEQLLIEFMAETTVEEWKELSAVFRRLADKLNKPDTE